jgi:nucleoside-diphosphate-sugar epimerase
LIGEFDRQGDPQRLVYLSTTGVYGDCGGRWIDESCTLQPQAARARRRVDAEQALTDWSRHTGRELVVLRVAGIYGPGKLPLERIRQGLSMVRESEAPYTNRIHADDLVSVCTAAMSVGRNGAVYNTSDGHPSSMTDYFRRVADLAGLPRPREIPLASARAQLSPGMLSYLRESRRLSNRKMLEELGVTLRYPSLAEGLPACFLEAE